MCILALALLPRCRVQFVILHNRDEDLDRETLPPNARADLIAGQDLRACCTCCGRAL